ncbi:metallophosphoesterase family protein [Salidesulfovibrio brasiliensis]|uniref:metallophosphoesterase family protein n=1 Tax=Salidesulfovibrio brasiliensis TaxID=221711 RepID=UPI0006D1998C|nr:metallophosphoesterase family protein [Salidesulfovibrio brasiliensis]
MTETCSRIAVLSDIHGNLEAFRAVLGDIESRDVEMTVSLGDVIGYGPDPQACADLVRASGIKTIMGNHEQGLINNIYLARFNPTARDMLLMTREMLDEETVQWLITRPKALTIGDCRFVHGCPPDLVSEYLWKHAGNYEPLFAAFIERYCFVGHTHELRHVHGNTNKATAEHLTGGTFRLDTGQRHIINAGAVGQPRGNGPDAKYLIFDTVAATIEVRFIPYDNLKTAEKIRRLGFNRAFADRLL